MGGNSMTRAEQIYRNVLDCMQDADEIEGVEDPKEYQYLMLKIAQVALARLQTSMENAL
jgi:hypothetical protein